MDTKTLPVEFIAVSDGILYEQEHCLIYMRNPRNTTLGLAFTLADAKALQKALEKTLSQIDDLVFDPHKLSISSKQSASSSVLKRFHTRCKDWWSRIWRQSND